MARSSAYYSRTFANGDTFKVDGFLGRSLFDLYSNFTFYLNDPVNGDAFQQHDSRLQEGGNIQYTASHRVGIGRHRLDGRRATSTTTRSTSDFTRAKAATPLASRTRANAHVTNDAGYAQESVTCFVESCCLRGGLRL